MQTKDTTTHPAHALRNEAPSDGSPAAPTGPPRDPRPAFRTALDVGGQVVATVQPADFDRPTPCAEYDVRTLTGHLIGVLRRIAVVGRGEDPFLVPELGFPVRDDALLEEWEDARAELEAVWQDDAILPRTLTLPFAELPAPIALGIYTSEVLVHTWDLASAIGFAPQWSHADDAIAMARATMAIALPPEHRGGEIPFAPPADPGADPSPIAELAAWTGRRPTAWPA